MARSRQRIAREGLFYSQRLVAGGQTVAAFGCAAVAMSVTDSNDLASIIIGPLTTSFALIQGLFSIVNGVLVFLRRERFFCPNADYASAINRSRGVLEVVSGVCLWGEGISMDIAEFVKGRPLNFSGLYLQFAIYSITQFILAFDNLRIYYQVCKSIRENNPEWQRYWLRNMGNLAATALFSAAWGILAITNDIGNKNSFICFAGASVLFAVTYVPRFLSFLNTLNKEKTEDDYTTHLSVEPKNFLYHPKPSDQYKLSKA